MTGFVRSQYVNVGATASAAILAFGLVTVPAERYDSVIARTESAAVQLQAVVATQVAALMNSAPNAGTVAADPSASRGISALIPSAAATAAASTGSDTLASIGRALLNLVGALVAPVWWLAFPITYRFYVSEQQRRAAPALYFETFPFTGWSWFAAPLILGNLVFPEITPAPAAATRAAASAAAAPVVVAPNSSTAQARSLYNKRQRAAMQRARAIVEPTATVSSVVAANTPQAIDTPASAAPSAGRTLRTARANKNTANTDATVAGASDLPSTSGVGASESPRRS